jgi:hypothetical protein
MDAQLNSGSANDPVMRGSIPQAHSGPIFSKTLTYASVPVSTRKIQDGKTIPVRYGLAGDAAIMLHHAGMHESLRAAICDVAGAIDSDAALSSFEAAGR